jgi:hypothetical protein
MPRMAPWYTRRMFRLPARLTHIILLTVGFTLGLIGVTVYEKTAPTAQAEKQPLANACTDTKTANDDIFFLSCGGIY